MVEPFLEYQSLHLKSSFPQSTDLVVVLLFLPREVLACLTYPCPPNIAKTPFTRSTEKVVEGIEECFPFKDKPTVTWVNVDGIADIDVVGKIGDGIRLLAKGELTAKLNIEVTGASAAAIAAVEKAGGKVSLIEAKTSEAPAKEAKDSK